MNPEKSPFEKMSEEEKIASFHKWVICKGPKVSTTLTLIKFLQNYIDYKLSNVGVIDACAEKMAQDFAFKDLIEKNFTEES